MSNKPVSYDAMYNVAMAVAEVLRASGPLKPVDIARALRREGWGYPRTNVINSALVFLGSRVARTAGGQFHLLDDTAGLETPPARRAAEPDIILAHQFSSDHREALLAGDACGCFHCLAIFAPVEIVEWIDNSSTAICPKCGIDSVIGERSGFPVTTEFLAQMQEHWFEVAE